MKFVGESSMVTAEVKEEQEVYVYLPLDYDEGKHILSCALSHFPKDGTKIIVFSIIRANYNDNELLNQRWERCNETLDKHLAQCTKQEFKAEQLIHRNDSTVKGILELINLWAMKNLVMGFPPNSKIPGLVKEKANPLCKIWFIHKGYLIFNRCPRLDLTEATSEEVKEEQKVYVFLTSIYDDEEHILSWALGHFPKDGTQIVATSIIPPPSKQNALINQKIERCLDKHVANCAIQEFKAVKLIHENDDVVKGILELIDKWAIKNLVMLFSPYSELVREKANPSCKIWFIQNGNLIYTKEVIQHSDL